MILSFVITITISFQKQCVGSLENLHSKIFDFRRYPKAKVFLKLSRTCLYRGNNERVGGKRV